MLDRTFPMVITLLPSTFDSFIASLHPNQEDQVDTMAPIAAGSQFDAAAMARRQALAGSSGPAALVKNFRVFSIACFACLGGLLYGYNQGVFSGVLTMTSFNNRKAILYI